MTVSSVYTSTLAAHASKPYTLTVRESTEAVRFLRFPDKRAAERERERLLAEGASVRT